jgi:hypothetical protein
MIIWTAKSDIEQSLAPKSCADQLIAKTNLKQTLFCSAIMQTCEDPFPVFPPELEREIFETAAERHPETIASLLLVSLCVNEWYGSIHARRRLFNSTTGSTALNIELSVEVRFVQS